MGEEQQICRANAGGSLRYDELLSANKAAEFLPLPPPVSVVKEISVVKVDLLARVELFVQRAKLICHSRAHPMGSFFLIN